MNNISQKIYSLRIKYNLTQAQLAKIAGVSDKAISAWELGTRDPKIKSIQNICTHFGIDVNSFIDQSTNVYEETPTPVSEDGLNKSAKAVLDACSDFTIDEWREMLHFAEYLVSKRTQEKQP